MFMLIMCFDKGKTDETRFYEFGLPPADAA